MFSSRWNNDAVTMPVNFNTVGNREQMMSARANEGLPHICDSFDSNYVGRRGRATRHYCYFVVGMKSCHPHRPLYPNHAANPVPGRMAPVFVDGGPHFGQRLVSARPASITDDQRRLTTPKNPFPIDPHGRIFLNCTH
jgi:hypothetical protein